MPKKSIEFEIANQSNFKRIKSNRAYYTKSMWPLDMLNLSDARYECRDMSGGNVERHCSCVGATSGDVVRKVNDN